MTSDGLLTTLSYVATRYDRLAPPAVGPGAGPVSAPGPPHSPNWGVGWHSWDRTARSVVAKAAGCWV
ncbi:hypothetical protein GA0070604_2300 [Micromonospora eburnea]|uniref:Uncharacterized protein n=1 Tax=Micromonospora eburnea TaxID=227316 RepID=A0A1C6UAQ7_9ACTN|nr:hypothetical protein GA0070604_2300 [Micromonospora eburnea]